MTLVSRCADFADWDREDQNLYLAELEIELAACRELALIPKVINAEAHIVVRHGIVE